MANSSNMQQARVNKVLDTLINYNTADGGVMTRREFIHRRIDSGSIPKIRLERSIALTNKRKEDYERALRRSSSTWGNKNHPDTIAFLQIEADIKANPWAMSSVYTLDHEDSYYHVITKIEYDYAVALHAAKD